MRISYIFNFNGWEHTIYLEIPITPPLTSIKFDIIGFGTGIASIDLEKRILTSLYPIDIKPYVPFGKIKTITKIKIPKETIIQIKTYLD